MSQTIQQDAGVGREFSIPFSLQQGTPEAVLPIPGEIDFAPTKKRGLTLRELTLLRSHDPRNFWGWLLHKPNRRVNEIFLVSIALDLNSPKPFVWPPEAVTADQAWVELREGETKTFNLGAGVPIFPPAELQSGIALAILIGESEEKERRAAQHVHDAVQKLNSDGDVLKFLAAAIASPATITAAAALGALVKAVDIVSGELAKNHDDNLGAYMAFFPATGKWKKENLEDGNADTRIRLEEVTA
jgi:hypothetical protein